MGRQYHCAECYNFTSWDSEDFTGCPRGCESGEYCRACWDKKCNSDDGCVDCGENACSSCVRGGGTGRVWPEHKHFECCDEGGGGGPGDDAVCERCHDQRAVPEHESRPCEQCGGLTCDRAPCRHCAELRRETAAKAATDAVAARAAASLAAMERQWALQRGSGPASPAAGRRMRAGGDAAASTLSPSRWALQPVTAAAGSAPYLLASGEPTLIGRLVQDQGEADSGSTKIAVVAAGSAGISRAHAALSAEGGSLTIISKSSNLIKIVRGADSRELEALKQGAAPVSLAHDDLVQLDGFRDNPRYIFRVEQLAVATAPIAAGPRSSPPDDAPTEARSREQIRNELRDELVAELTAQHEMMFGHQLKVERDSVAQLEKVNAKLVEEKQALSDEKEALSQRLQTAVREAAAPMAPAAASATAAGTASAACAAVDLTGTDSEEEGQQRRQPAIAAAAAGAAPAGPSRKRKKPATKKRPATKAQRVPAASRPAAAVAAPSRPQKGVVKKGLLMCMYCTARPGVIDCACCGAADAKKCERCTWTFEVEGIGYCEECCDEEGEDATKCTRCGSNQKSKKCCQCDTLHCEDCFDAECGEHGVFCEDCEHGITFCGACELCSLCSESSGGCCKAHNMGRCGCESARANRDSSDDY